MLGQPGLRTFSVFPIGVSHGGSDCHLPLCVSFSCVSNLQRPFLSECYSHVRLIHHHSWKELKFCNKNHQTLPNFELEKRYVLLYSLLVKFRSKKKRLEVPFPDSRYLLSPLCHKHTWATGGGEKISRIRKRHFEPFFLRSELYK